MTQKRNTGRVVVGVTVLVAALLCLAAWRLWKQSATPFLQSGRDTVNQPLSPIRAASTSPFAIQIDPAVCADLNLRSDLEVVARDVAAAVQQRFAGTPPESCPIVLTRGLHPHVFPPRNGVIRVELGFNFQHRDYARLAYEFGHEMGHVMVGTRGYACGVEEVLATAASLQALDDLDAQWAIRPPYPTWQDFHSYFCQYRAQVEEQSLAALSIQVQQAVRQRRWDAVTLFLRYHIPAMEADIRSESSRNLQTLGAILLRSTTLPWPEFTGVAPYLSYRSAAEAKTATGLPPGLQQAHTALWRYGDWAGNIPLCFAPPISASVPQCRTAFCFRRAGNGFG